jgi:tripartite ATP-independent transporter DctP family solute receptor
MHHFLKNRLNWAGAAFFALVCSGFSISSAHAQAANAKVLKLGISLSAESVEARAMQFLAQRVETLSQGRLRIDVTPGGKLGDDVSMIKAMQAGTQDMGGPDGSTLAPLVKDFSVISYPFTFISETEADTILDGRWGQNLMAKLPSQGVVGLAFFENGFRQITNSRRPLASATDFQGVRLRTMQNPMLIDSFARLGFDAVPMAFPKVYEALSKQEVDGQENPLPTILSSKFYEVQKYLTLSRHVYSVHVLLISGKTWDSLGAEDQKLLQTAATEAKDFQRRLNRSENASALSTLKEKGMQVTEISRADAERIRNRLRDVLDKYNREIGAASVLDMYVELSRLRTKDAFGK